MPQCSQQPIGLIDVRDAMPELGGGLADYCAMVERKVIEAFNFVLPRDMVFVMTPDCHLIFPDLEEGAEDGQ